MKRPSLFDSPSLLLTLIPSMLLLTSPVSGREYTKEKDAVLLKDVKVLTLHNGRMTTGRRVSSIPQVVAAGGPAASYFTPQTLRCTNVGQSYTEHDVEWTCTAMLPPEFKLGGTEVTCEGWDNDADPYILKGSCGVEYRLMFTEMGEKKWEQGEKVAYDQGWRSEGPGSEKGDTGDVLSMRRTGDTVDRVMTGLFWLAFVGVLGYAAYNYWSSRGRTSGGTRRGGRGGAGGGGGYGGDDRPDYPDDPPPPYYPPRTPKSEYAASPKKTRNSPSSTASSRGKQSGPSSFLSGAATAGAAGAAAGWFAGRRSAGTQSENRGDGGGESSRSAAGGASSSTRSSSSWFGGGGGGSSSSQRTAPQGSPSEPSSSYSSERYESTGFGGTKRR
ncbi:MAG: hypothetical protein M1831_006056 [Alyxoria varia]|nr:MAG: hypothetical protein M1831_006056 [Alyxoria varia]